MGTSNNDITGFEAVPLELLSGTVSIHPTVTPRPSVYMTLPAELRVEAIACAHSPAERPGQQARRGVRIYEMGTDPWETDPRNSDFKASGFEIQAGIRGFDL